MATSQRRSQCQECKRELIAGKRGPLYKLCLPCRSKLAWRNRPARTCPTCQGPMPACVHRCYECNRARRRAAAQAKPRTGRSVEAHAYRKLYRSIRWKALRAEHLLAEPNCRMCLEEGEQTAATVCDHIIPHKGDEQMFWQGPFQSLCGPHHCGAKQREERKLAA